MDLDSGSAIPSHLKEEETKIKIVLKGSEKEIARIF